MSAATSAGKVRPLTDSETRDLTAWRASALEAMPYMASILFALRPLANPGLGTFAVDRGLRLYVDFERVGPRGDRWCSEALLHECGHVLGSHADRADEVGVTRAERRTWNLASDAEINDDLVEAGCATIEADGILPASLGQHDHLLAETYFRALRDQAERSGHGQGQAGQPDQGKGDPDTAPQDGCGSISGAGAVPGELNAADDADGTAPAASAGEIQLVKIATAAAIREAESKSRGSVPSGMVTLAEGILAPSKVPWRTLLASTIRAGIRTRSGTYDHTYLRPDRRHRNVQVSPGRRAVYPGSYEPNPTVAVIRDTSGSMGHDDLMAVASEIDAIARRIGVRGRDLRVLDTDAEVHAVRGYTRPASIAEAIGRGGTDMARGIQAASELRPRPHVIVVITDGATPWPTERVGIPVVACLVGPGAEGCQADVPAWIRSVVVDDR